MKIPLQTLDAAALLNQQSKQRFDVLSITDSVDASGSKIGSVFVGQSGSFFCTHITGRFSSLSGAANDSGLCYLRGQLKDGVNTPLFDSHIPFDLWMTPGRVKSLAAAGSDSNPMYLPMKINHLFAAGQTIFLDVRNDSPFANSYTVMFWGIRIFGNPMVRSR
ncbi:MAG TPA: hypothetical protein VLH56_19580 [Dissulfurispiraceae bacterium]|nr:hypothetical protein [Dissulfurispiraceae bacterium]